MMEMTALMPVRALGSLGRGAWKGKRECLGGAEEAISGDKR
jgi:hypothetical protein